MPINNYFNGALVVSHVEEGRHEVVRDGRSDVERDDPDGQGPRSFDDREQRIAELREYGKKVGEYTTLAEAISVAKGRNWREHCRSHDRRAAAADARLRAKREAQVHARREAATLPNTPPPPPPPAEPEDDE